MMVLPIRPTKLQCILVYRLAEEGNHGERELLLLAGIHTHNNDDLTKISARVIRNGPPNIPGNQEVVGGIKTRRSGLYQFVYCADSDAICFCVVTGLGYHDRVAMMCVGEISRQFHQTCGGLAVDVAAANSLSGACKTPFESLFAKFEDSRRIVNKSTRAAHKGGHEPGKGEQNDELTQWLSALKKKKKAEGKPKRVRFAPPIVGNDYSKEAQSRPSGGCFENVSAGEIFISALLLGQPGLALPSNAITARNAVRSRGGDGSNVESKANIVPPLDSPENDSNNNAVGYSTLHCSGEEVEPTLVLGEMETRSFGSSSSNGGFVDFVPFESFPTLFPYDVPTGMTFCGCSPTTSGASTIKSEAQETDPDSICESAQQPEEPRQSVSAEPSFLLKMTARLLATENQLREGACENWEGECDGLDSYGNDTGLSSRKGALPKPTQHGSEVRLVGYSMEDVVKQLQELERENEEQGDFANDWKCLQPPRKRHDKKPTPPQMRQPFAIPDFITI
ncbi:expressed unknown protein [Seminavis robusta]|uniref:Uncharacterized protein n=1 Tax=Seminavis robusta TaxID=568900 RepID=A0A9N8HSB4_9STRA|nr:expressed unknown protein [Seminavis robusta]|eukprot:Sro1501_g277880.1 n/a (507) ;mRNA; f:5649-7247